MDHEDIRMAIVAEAKTWLNTPYLSNACIKGRRGGVDCAMLLVAVYGDLGIIPKEFDPRPYPPQWHVHKEEEKYLKFIEQFAHEIPGAPLPGDIVVFKVGRTFAHGAIIVDWPVVIHARGPMPCTPEDISLNTTGKHNLASADRKFYSFW